MNKPSKFDEHVEEEQYVDNPLQMSGLPVTASPPVNVTITVSNTSANQITPVKRSCNSSSFNHTRCGLHLDADDPSKLLDVDATNDSSVHSAVVRKRNSAQSTTEIPKELVNLNSSTTIYYKPIYDYKNTTRSYSLNDSRTSRSPLGSLPPPKLYYKTYPNEGGLYAFKIKKETEDYRMLEKRRRRRNRVRRSLYQLPFNEMIYRPLHRRYYVHANERMDPWDPYDQHRRYVRFPLAADAFRPSRPLSAPPAPAPAIWTSPQLPQYTAYQQALPPVPSMGPRSPRLVFRDPVEPGTLQAPFSPNGLQDLTAPEDNRGM